MSDNAKEILVVTRHDPALEGDINFVNYTPSNLLSRQHRKTVNSFVNSVKKRKSNPAKARQGRRNEAGKATPSATGRPLAQPVQASVQRPTGRNVQQRDLGYFIGGLRTDPFNSYPVPARDSVTKAVDVYCQIWAPSHIDRFFPDASSNFLLSELFPLALQHVGLFDALVAWSLCFFSTYYQRDAFPTKEVLYYRGKAIRQLRTSLMPSPQFSNDVAIVTLVFLMGMDYLMDDITTSDMLLQAMYQLVDHAGGLDKLGLKGMTKAIVLRIEKESTKRRNRKSRYTEIALTERLDYPTHPFRPDLCNSIATMPKGFRDLALEAVLSIQMLQILERMSAWHTCREHVHRHMASPEETALLHNHDPQVDTEGAHRALEILMASGVEGGIEWCLFHGLIAYSSEVFAQKEFSPELYWIIRDFPLALGTIEPKPIEVECLIWMSVVAVGTYKGFLSQKGSEVMDKLLRDHPWLREWDRMEQTMRKFFWSDSIAADWKKSWNTTVTRRTLTREDSTHS